jgi:hypothetical protein
MAQGARKCKSVNLSYRAVREQIVADEFQYFPAMPHDRLRHRVEITRSRDQ